MEEEMGLEDSGKMTIEDTGKMEEEMGLDDSGKMTIEENVADRIAGLAQMTTKEDFDRELLQVEAEFNKQIGKNFATISLIGHQYMLQFYDLIH